MFSCTVAMVAVEASSVDIYQIQNSEYLHWMLYISLFLLFWLIEKERPTVQDLNKYVVREYADEWYNVGMELGLELDILDNIDKDHLQQNVICFQKALEKWLKLDNCNATWKLLEVALSGVNANRNFYEIGDFDGKYI